MRTTCRPLARLRVAAGVGLAAVALLSIASASAAAWEVRCSDAGYCTATTEGAAPDGRRTIFKLERDGEADSPVFVTTGPDEPIAIGMRVEIDVLGLEEPYGVWGDIGRVWAGNETTFAGPARRPLVENLRRGSAALVTVHFGGTVGSVAYEVPLAGLTLALLAFDREQGRLDRTDAIVAWGGVPLPRAADAGSPAPPAEPVADGLPETVGYETSYELAEIPDAFLRFGPRLGCELADAVPAFGVGIHRFADGRVLAIVPCRTGDINIETYVVAADDDAGRGATLVMFDAPPGEAPEPRETIVNAEWHPERARISGTLFHGPDGDCGFHEEHALIPGSFSFEIVETRHKPDCDGLAMPPAEYPLEWSAAEAGR